MHNRAYPFTKQIVENVRWSWRSAAAMLVAASFFCTFGIDLPSAFAAGAPDKKNKQDASLKNLPITELSPEEAIQHALNRLAYGPRPGDVERVKQMGLAKWIDQQLNPNSIDDKAVEARLENYPTLKMSTAKLLEEYPQPKQAEKQAAKAAQASTPPQNPADQSRSDAAAAVVARDMQFSKGQRTSARSASANSEGSQEQAASAPPSMKDDPDTQNPATRGQGGGNNKLSVDPNAVPRAIADDSKRPQRVVEELAMAKVTRAIYSERQLQQVMDDFWFNHFNVYAAKGEVKWYLTSYERDAIQPHTLGKFKDLIEATSKSPAMLFYLDNYLSADPRSQQRIAAERAARQASRRGFGGWPPPSPPPQQQKKKQERGLNENYGRELMELHTLGVDGGYTQKDVTEVARCFTGWTIEKPRQNPEFKFDEKLHDPDTKVVLGKKIHAGGMSDGKEVIDLLVKHPSTAKFISAKLARRFVSDNPPQSLIAKMAQTFQSSDGDIRAVMHTMIYSPEFWSRETFRAKIKTPYELVISAARALGTDVDTPMPLVQWTGRIGEPLYQCQPPTGYSDKADAWVNTGALLNRLNYSLALAGNKVRGAHSDAATLLGLDSSSDPKTALNRGIELFLGGNAARATVETLEKQVEDPQILQAKLDDPVKRVDMGVVTGLVLGAPEFQRR
ncbi:MAG TPA: DUF1800 domain-containing protein [Candidatus Dormibacteraeota bacterium]|nr:DUF1800 domain-containing protein [Candidatus Dormibacteraeota bacterium]